MSYFNRFMPNTNPLEQVQSQFGVPNQMQQRPLTAMEQNQMLMMQHEQQYQAFLQSQEGQAAIRAFNEALTAWAAPKPAANTQTPAADIEALKAQIDARDSKVDSALAEILKRLEDHPKGGSRK